MMNWVVLGNLGDKSCLSGIGVLGDFVCLGEMGDLGCLSGLEVLGVPVDMSGLVYLEVWVIWGVWVI